MKGKRKGRAAPTATKAKPKKVVERAPVLPPPRPSEVKITAAKGRPMLVWVGKRPLRQVIAYPAQHVETFAPIHSAVADTTWSDWPGVYPRGGLLFHGDNEEVLAHLLANGFRNRVNLIYIDPPFDSGADYVRKVSLRGGQATAKIDAEGYTLGEQIQYTDIWANDNYLQFMFERFLLMRELLAESGFVFVQCDHRKNHHLRCLLDEAFGPDNFRNEIASRRGVTSVQAQFEEIDSLIPAYYTTLLYSKSPDVKLPLLRTKRIITTPGRWDTLWRNHDRPTMRYELCGVTPKEGQWRWAEARGKRAEANYKQYLEQFADTVELDEYFLDHFTSTGEMLDMVKLGEDGNVQCYIPPQAERLANNLWLDFPHMGSVTDYPTEKSEEMLARAITWTTRPGDLVLDCFLGSGTTAAVAQKLGRRWIGCDINKGAIQTAAKRLQAVMLEEAKEPVRVQGELGVGPGASEGAPLPAQSSFTVWRVNDYDLQIQHNEAVNLAAELLGVQRTRADGYFDGTLGNSLVKIAPFDHPLTPLDLEDLRRELDSRPDEDRPVTVVCLGIEVAAQAAVEEWNALRRGAASVNKINVIELRTDPKYGKFLKHEPARARVKIERRNDQVRVEIQDFISPSIVERLRQQAGVLSPKIEDWRAMVDCVMIDSAYDGQVFNVALSDVPERKTDLVKGVYELTAPGDETTVAVKVVDMLGDEVLVIETV